MKRVTKPSFCNICLIIPIIFTGGSVAGCLAMGPVHGARATGMGTAFVAVADDPSAIAFNPAGLTQLQGTSMYGGLTLFAPYTSYTSPAGYKEKAENKIYFPPHLYICSSGGFDNLRFGLGVFSPFGIGGRIWPDSGMIRYLSAENLTATMTANPVAAYRVNSRLSLAAGLNLMYALSSSKRSVNQSTFGSGDGQVEINQDGFGWGLNAGVIYKPFDNFKFGFAYRSAIKIDLTGDAEFNGIAPRLKQDVGNSRVESNVKSPVEFPSLISIGGAWQPTDNWLLTVEYEWGGWSSFEYAEMDFETEYPAAGFVDQRQHIDWDNAWQLKFGLEHRFTESLSVRCGYTFITSMVPDDTLSPVSPDAESQNVTLGTGYRFGRWVLDLAYSLGIYEERKVKNELLSGTYENGTHVLALSLGYHF